MVYDDDGSVAPLLAVLMELNSKCFGFIQSRDVPPIGLCYFQICYKCV